MKSSIVMVMMMVFSAMSFGLIITNPNFDDDILNDGGWGGCPSGWSGSAALQNLSTANGLSPEAQSGENVAILNEGDWITSSTITDDLDNEILLESNKSYEITVWIGRRGDDCGTYAGIVKAWLSCPTIEASAGTLPKIDSVSYDMEGNVDQGAWSFVTFMLMTGDATAYEGETLFVGFDNIGDRAGDSNWLAQVILDSASVNEIPEPATLLLLSAGGLLLRRKNK